jgi:hypothetical protein
VDTLTMADMEMNLCLIFTLCCPHLSQVRISGLEAPASHGLLHGFITYDGEDSALPRVAPGSDENIQSFVVLCVTVLIY